MLCITGIPGSGKSTLCRALKDNGINCVGVMEIPGAEGCKSGDEVDLDCLESKLASVDRSKLILEGHFSHLLGCDSVIILERSEEQVRFELERRKYPLEKIEENIDVLRSDIIYRESLEFIPSTRIYRLTVREGHPDEALVQCMKIIERLQRNH